LRDTYGYNFTPGRLVRVQRCQRSSTFCSKSIKHKKIYFSFWSTNSKCSIAAGGQTLKFADNHPVFPGLPRKLPRPQRGDDFREAESTGSRCGQAFRRRGSRPWGEAKRLRSFARAVDYILADQEFLRESFHLAVHDFIEHQRQHLEKEERLLFPAAVKALRSKRPGGNRCRTG
jgi:hypothetical protein